MFVDAIEKINAFTRPIHTISRLYESDEVIPGASTLFFVNELGYAITCRHVAELIAQADAINSRHKEIALEILKLSRKKGFNGKKKEIEKKYSVNKSCVTQIKNTFINCVDSMSEFKIEAHPTEDVAIISFVGFSQLPYTGHAVFLKNSSKIKQGQSLCRLGYPFPEFSNFTYDKENDDILWTSEGKPITPSFPIDGIVTRNVLGENNKVTGIEVSTPGLRGQSGGPLFDQRGVIYGMQSSTHHLHLGFDIKDGEIRENGKIRKISNYPFLHLGRSVHVDVIKDFLKEKGVKFYESED